MRLGGFLLVAAILLVFTDFFHFAFHEAPSRHDSACVFSLPEESGVIPVAVPDDSPSAHHNGFCPVCEGILVSDGPPPAQYGCAVLPYAADPIFSGIGFYVSVSFLLPQGRAPPRAA